MAAQSGAIERWVQEIGELTTPDRVVYCDGSAREGEALTQECVRSGELILLNQQKLPGCYLHRSASHDVARTEHLTFISTEIHVDAGPNNNWMSPADARAKTNPDNTSVSNAASSSSVAGARNSRRSRTAASANPHPLNFTRNEEISSL